MYRVVRFIVLGIVLLGVAGFILRERSVPSSRVIFFDVGQGDAILVQLESGFDILIDGGPDSTLVQKLGERLPYFDRTIELLIVTHPDADHVNGLPEVARRYAIERVLWTGVKDELSTYQALQSILAEQHTTELFARDGQRFDLPGGTLDVLHPTELLQGQSPEDSNALSVVVRLALGSHHLLLTGDADLAAEESMVASSSELQSDILKAGHHGSKSATGEAFLDAVQPAFAVISAGRENRYGHPHAEVINRLLRRGVSIRSTIERGDICFEGLEGNLQECK